MNNNNLILLFCFICSLCLSIPIKANDEVSPETARLLYDQNEKRMKAIPASLGEAEQNTIGHHKNMFSWSKNLWQDTFM